MSPPYQRLRELSDQARRQQNARHDHAVALATRLLHELFTAFGVPDQLQQRSRSPEMPKQALELCRLPDNDRDPLPDRLGEGDLSTEDIVTTKDGENYRFGLIVRIHSLSGFEPHAVVFRVNMRHTRSDHFEVRLWKDAEPHVYSASGAHAEPLSTFSDLVFNTLKDYFTAALRDEKPKTPAHFELLSESN